MGGQRGGVDAGPGDDDHAQVRDPLLGSGEGGDHPPQQVGADARAADGDDADTLVVAVAELVAQPAAVAQLGRVEAGDVTGEVEVALGPVADHRQLRPEALVDDVVGIADEERHVAHARVVGDVVDHVGVVVGGEEALALAAVLHRQEADEVGQPGKGDFLLSRVLVQVVVELPGLVADPKVVALLAHDVVEEHEVGGEDLVHAAQRRGSSAGHARQTPTRSAWTRWPGAGWPGGCARPPLRARG